MNDSWVLEQAKYWWERLNGVYNTKYERPRVFISDKVLSTVNGRCFYRCPVEVEFFEHLIISQGEKYTQTIGHEMAHAHNYMHYKYSQGHGPKWKHAMRLIGLPPVRCSSYDDPNRPKLICTCCGQKMNIGPTQLKRLKAHTQTYMCRGCKASITCNNGGEVTFLPYVGSKSKLTVSVDAKIFEFRREKINF